MALELKVQSCVSKVSEGFVRVLRGLLSDLSGFRAFSLVLKVGGAPF